MTYSEQATAATEELDGELDEFLGALTALGGSAGNVRLREILEWDDAAYNSVKAVLVDRGLIVPGRGRGGSVALAGDHEVGGAGASEAAKRSRATRTSNGKSGSSFEQAFRVIDDCLRKESGCGTELDYTEQTSWLLFLKYLDGLEEDRAAMALLEGRSHQPILEDQYRWNSWAAPKDSSGQLDHNAADTGDDLRDFVSLRLFPYLEQLRLPRFRGQ